MKQLSYHIILLLAIATLCGCEKYINIDYHNTRPRYTVQGWITPYETIVKVSQTKNMDDTISTSGITNAIVTITDPEGNVHEIPYHSKDNYMSDFSGAPGKTYQLDVVVDGEHFSSSSTMYRMPDVRGFRLVWRKMMSERYIFGEVKIQDFPNETNYYYIHIYKNGVPYRSAVLKDDSNPGKELQQLFALNREGSSDNNALKEGDLLEAEVRTIDERSYDYLYSVLQMDNTSTNPVMNFSGGCLGYFSAFSPIGYGFGVKFEDIDEE